ncbi:MAG TPA: response regulator [Elusimicrobiota bacterium]|nr:response regulator [Elusimicrobiota bacterium]
MMENDGQELSKAGRVVGRVADPLGRPPRFAGDSSPKGRVLVVDDEPVVRKVLERFLRSKGLSVSVAEGGVEALSLVKKERPHIMLLDLWMPKMNGIEVLKAVREIDREIAVIISTANADVDIARKTMEMGACDYIIKPFDLPYLETALSARLLMLTA